MDKEAEIARIKAEYEARNREIDRQHRNANLRIGSGAILQGISALPIFNIPYVGTGLGGALFEAGNAIMEGKSGEDIKNDAGRGFLIGEAVGFLPPVAQKLAKTKAGQAVGNQASKLYNYLADTKVGQKVAEIAPKVEDALMTDIKAYNPFKQTQTAYHGSPYDFNKFSNEAIGTGEGAQAHGYGHYAALDKDVADIRYRQALTDDDFDNMQYFYNGKKIEDKREKAILATILENGKEKVVKVRENNLPRYKYDEKEYKQKLKELDFVKNINENLIKKDTDKGQLYKLSIPKDDVMLRENLPMSKQPKFVQNAIDKINKEMGLDTYANLDAQSLKISEQIRNEYNQNNIDWGKVRELEVLQEQINNKKMTVAPNLTGKQYYKQIGKNSDLLNQHGIKGISYNGGLDGEARVIFNPNDIEIVRKYYNQPSLGEQILGKTPNAGAVSNKIYEYLTNPKANQNFEKDLEMLYKPQPNMDPNQIRVKIGDLSDKAFDLGMKNGYDLTNFLHTLDNSAFNHFRNGHFGENEIDPRLIPLNDNDIKNIPNVIYNPDFLEFLPATKRKNPRIKYGKNVDDGTQIYVEELLNKKKRLNTKTMWKEKN